MFQFHICLICEICELYAAHIYSAIHVTSHIDGRIYAIFICHIYDCSVWGEDGDGRGRGMEGKETRNERKRMGREKVGIYPLFE